MQNYLGKTGLEKSWQLPFEENVLCVHCGSNSRIAFVCFEDNHVPQAEVDVGQPFVCNLYPNRLAEGGAFWPHDAIAVAVYFCEKLCAGGVTAVYNQA